MGYEKVDLIDTTNWKWIRRSEAGWMAAFVLLQWFIDGALLRYNIWCINERD